MLVALISLQSNLPFVIYMRSQGYRPPERVINVVSGVGTLVASQIGPSAVSLPVPLVPLIAGPTAGDPSIRHRSVYVPAGALLLIALLAGTAADLAVLVPPVLLLALAGLALVGVLVSSLREIARGPLLLGPIFEFAIALSDMRLLDLGPFFWSLVLGTGVSLLLERDEWKRLRTDVVDSREARADEHRDLASRTEAHLIGVPHPSCPFRCPRQGTPYICAGTTWGFAAAVDHRWKLEIPTSPWAR